MTRVLLVDDEPLVLIGMQDMLNWAALGYAPGKPGKKSGAKPKNPESTKQAGKAADAESEE